ncbi:MAG TPA: hypothetical protein VMP08_10460 [Anaerolineae bacterium]|nr:hypothetical protein [Anaerolineae bacterium]
MEGVVAALTAMQSRWANVSAPRSTTIKTLIDDLNEFAQKQFCYFHTSFANGSLDLSTEFPPEYVYSTMLEQIQYDIDVLQRVIDERGSGDGVMRDTLLGTADRLASLALSHAREANLIEAETVALTYFHKAPSIRVIPYAPAALIAVPYLVLASRRDYLAIPHEAGHYVFWHGKQAGVPIYRAAFERLRDLLKGKMNPDTPEFIKWFDWLQEVFADVYGCMVAGPVMAVDFQDLQTHTSREEFGQSDGRHPTPALRPFIYHQALHRIAGAGSNWSQQANILWQNWFNHLRANYNQPVELLPQGAGQAAQKVNVNIFNVLFTLPGVVDDLVTIALDLLKGVQPGDWTNNTASADLYTAFENTFFSATTAKGVINEAVHVFDWQQWMARLEADSDAWMTENQQRQRAPKWWWLLMAGGWTAEGPNTFWP